ncbi:MAG: GNAT family N-acetyltransferase [Candidatus Saliniplasma sp.]
MVFVRTFRLEDVKKVMKIADISLKEEYDEELFLTLYSAWNTGFFVAVQETTIVGFICGTIIPGENARVLMLAVHPLYRRQGIGSTLMDVFIGRCTMDDVNIVVLEVRPTNNVAINFYLKRNFKPVETLEDFYTNGEKALKMVKHL